MGNEVTHPVDEKDFRGEARVGFVSVGTETIEISLILKPLSSNTVVKAITSFPFSDLKNLPRNQMLIPEENLIQSFARLPAFRIQTKGNFKRNSNKGKFQKEFKHNMVRSILERDAVNMPENKKNQFLNESGSDSPPSTAFQIKQSGITTIDCSIRIPNTRDDQYNDSLGIEESGCIHDWNKIITVILDAESAEMNVRFIDAAIGAGHVIAVRFAIQGIVSIPFFIKDPSTIMKPVAKEIILLVLSGITMGASIIGTYYSYNFISAIDVSTISNAQPVVVLIISSIWLKERIGILDVINVGIVLIGITCLCQPEFLFGHIHDENTWIGYLSSGVSVILLSFATTSLRRLSNHNPATVLIIQSIMVILLSYVWSAIDGGESDPLSTEVWVKLFVGASLSASARIMTTVAIRYECSYIIATVDSLEILFTMILQIIILKEIPNGIGILGSLLVTFGVVITTMKEKITSLFQKICRSKYRNRTDEENDHLIA
ncbi:Solute carrier family 35 member G1 [Nymphon striatum]|nr:Solute carrier family 35 member G1 [Nymphon striatum]